MLANSTEADEVTIVSAVLVLPLQYPSCRIEDCTGIYGEDSVSEELDDFVKECRAAAVDKKASDFTVGLDAV